MKKSGSQRSGSSKASGSGKKGARPSAADPLTGFSVPSASTKRSSAKSTPRGSGSQSSIPTSSFTSTRRGQTSTRGSSRGSYRGSSLGSSRGPKRGRGFGRSSTGSRPSSTLKSGSGRSSIAGSSLGSSRASSIGSSRASSMGSSRGISERDSDLSTRQDSKSDAATQPRQPGTNGVYVLRPGENMNTVFPDWSRTAMDKYGMYEAKDLNMPNKLAKRSGGLRAYKLDPPLSHLGVLEAKLIGRGLKHSQVRFTAVYASPAFRCLQSAKEVVKSMEGAKGKLSIRVEPGLAEWQGWHLECPRFLTSAEAVDAGFPLDADYQPLTTLHQLLLQRNETVAEAYLRVGRTLATIVERERKRGGGRYNVLILAHSLVLDTASLYRLSSPAPDQGALARLRRSRLELAATHYPPGALLHLRAQPDAAHRLHPAPLPPIHSLTFNTALPTAPDNSLAPIAA